MNLTSKEYRNIIDESRLDCKLSMEERLSMLIGKSCEEEDIKDCGVVYVSEKLLLDWGRTHLLVFSEEAMAFFRSTFLSDYFKSSIKTLLEDEELDEVTLNALNGEKDINDMSEEEVKAIIDAINKYCQKEDRKYLPNIAYYIDHYLYKLNGPGVMSYIKNNISGREIAEQIVFTSGIPSTRPEFFAGCGVRPWNFNSDNLTEMFLKLMTIDKQYAIAFAKMVLKVKILCETEFMESFYDLGAHDFEISKTKICDNSYSLNSVPQERLNSTALAYAFLAHANGTTSKSAEIKESEDMQTTESIKRTFIKEIKPLLDKIAPDFDYEGYEQDEFGRSIFNTYYGTFSQRIRAR